MFRSHLDVILFAGYRMMNWIENCRGREETGGNLVPTDGERFAVSPLRPGGAAALEALPGGEEPKGRSERKGLTISLYSNNVGMA